MPPISELTAGGELTVTRNLLEPAGASRRMGYGGYSEGGDAFIVNSGGATGRPHREHRQVPQRRQQHRPHLGRRVLQSAEPSQLQAESPRAARER